MSSIARQAELIGRMLRTRLNGSSQAPTNGIARLLAKLEHILALSTAKRWLRPETGQEIANRAGLFAVGETVKQRIGIPGLRFFAPRPRGHSLTLRGRK